ncbi:SNF2-related protein [Streptomonospora algeriensis]|uniref:SNF2-related protein n=1 Tax=Streptomonospora algeriensis TaxID=995084 RepID=A0ABW3BC88_9ACTN
MAAQRGEEEQLLMPAGTASSLRLLFNATRTGALLEASEEHKTALARLALKFPGANRPNQCALDVSLDEFLREITALAQWPHPEGIVWDPDLQHLVEEELASIQEADKRLADGASAPPAIAEEEVSGLLSENWRAELTSFQLRDIAELLSASHAANFSVPGAGKTRVAMAVYAARREQGRVRRALVVAPKSAFEAWAAEADLCFAKSPRVSFVDKGEPLAQAEILVVNYERLPRMAEMLASWLSAAPAMIVLDEAHRMKLGLKGAYGTACMELGPLARCRMILTGTPAPNGAKDLENLMSFVWPGQGRHKVQRAVAGGDLGHASRVLRPLFSRTTKAELGLPKIDFKIARVELPPLHHEIYAALCGQFSERAAAAPSDLDSIGKSTLQLIMAATTPALLTSGTTRYEPLEHQVPPLDPNRDESLLSLLYRLPQYEMSPKYTFIRNLTTAAQVLSEYNPALVHGGVTDREEQLARFRTDPDCWVLLSNPATLGEGISLHQHCHDAVYLDRDFIAGRFLQSLDRIHRLGLPPDAETNVTLLVANETVDEVVAERLADKLEFMGKILDDPGVQALADPYEEVSYAGGMTDEDVRSLMNHAAAVSSRA